MCKNTDYICTTCRIFVCTECFLKSIHLKHDVLTKNEFIENITPTFNKITELKTDMKKILENTDVLIDNHIKKTILQINDKFDEQIMKLNVKRNEIITDFKQRFAQECKNAIIEFQDMTSNVVLDFDDINELFKIREYDIDVLENVFENTSKLEDVIKNICKDNEPVFKNLLLDDFCKFDKVELDVSNMYEVKKLNAEIKCELLKNFLEKTGLYVICQIVTYAPGTYQKSTKFILNDLTYVCTSGGNKWYCYTWRYYDYTEMLKICTQWDGPGHTPKYKYDPKVQSYEVDKIYEEIKTNSKPLSKYHISFLQKIHEANWNKQVLIDLLTKYNV